MKLKRYILSIGLTMISALSFAADPDVIVTQNDEILKVYNLDISPEGFVYYTMDEMEGSPFQRIGKKDILIIKKADGSKIDFDNRAFISYSQNQTVQNSFPGNTNDHEPNTFKSLNTEFQLREYYPLYSLSPEPGEFVLVSCGDGEHLNMRLLSREEKTLAVAKPFGTEYHTKELTIPEYVDINGEIYTVTQLDSQSISGIGVEDIENIIFPNTLTIIKEWALAGCTGLKRLILPESVTKIEDQAFLSAGSLSSTFEQLYIPKTVREIGKDAFRGMGPDRSFRGYFQGNLSSLPDYITEGNCTSYGLDDVAVRDYENKYKRRM